MIKKLTGILLLAFSFFVSAFCQPTSVYALNQDTTISGTWTLTNKILKVNNAAKVLGTGTVTGGYIDASYYQNIFDSTVSVNIQGGAYGIISTSWYGANTSKTDNKFYFQKAVNNAIGGASLGNIKLYTPAGSYKVSGEIFVGYNNGTNLGFSGISLYWYGDYRFNGANNGTVLLQQVKGGALISIQKGKGVTIEGLSLIGKWTNPNLTVLQYYNTAYNSYMDSACTDFYCGIAVDQYSNNDVGGSTGIHLNNLNISNFTNLIRMSAGPNILNGEGVIIENIFFGDGKRGFVASQAQEKMNVIRNCFFWGRCYMAITIGNAGLYQSGNYHISDINIAGGVCQIFDISQAGWFPNVIDNVYAESIARIGTFATSLMNISINNSHFFFAYQNEAGIQTVINSNHLKVIFTQCDFFYYGSDVNLLMTGFATFIDCNYPSGFKASNTSSKFTSTYQFINP